MSDRNGDRHGQAEKYAVVGSLAAEYAKHYQAIRSQVGSALGTTNKTKIKGGYRLCDEKKENCSTLTAFRTQKGKVSTIRSHGQPLDQAFRQLSQSATDSPLTFTARSAYVSSNGIMQVLVDIRNDGDRPLLPQGYSSAWIDASGRQTEGEMP